MSIVLLFSFIFFISPPPSSFFSRLIYSFLCACCAPAASLSHNLSAHLLQKNHEPRHCCSKENQHFREIIKHVSKVSSFGLTLNVEERFRSRPLFELRPMVLVSLLGKIMGARDYLICCSADTVYFPAKNFHYCTSGITN